MESLIYLFLALVGLGFLIFIHELGHYIVARRVGMKVEVFSIGFGKPIRSWEFQGVKWQLCYLPFGGYVKIAGMEKKGSLEPHQIPDGFFGKGPAARIKVALAGPLVNFAFAFLVFLVIWLSGGQEKPFQQHTNVIGYVDTGSQLYDEGLRPGDKITTFAHEPTDGVQKLIQMDVHLHAKDNLLEGKKISYSTGQQTPFSDTLSSQNAGILPASYVIFSEFTSSNSPLTGTGIQKGDRILWVNGNYIFSNAQLSTVLNDNKTALTIQRGDSTFFTSVPRQKIAELDFDAQVRTELEDWQHAAQIEGKLPDLYFIPCSLTHDGVVTNSSLMEIQTGDRIVAVEGTPTSNVEQILTQLQQNKMLIIVDRSPASGIPSWKSADDLFISSFHPEDVAQISSTIGTDHPVTAAGSLVLLPTVTTKPLSDLTLYPSFSSRMQQQYDLMKKSIDKIDNPEERAKQMSLFEQMQKRLVLGIDPQDRQVAYNPSPIRLFADSLDQTWRTLTHLATGFVSPKNLTGPIGIVQVLQISWASGIKSALFWLGFISLNLAILNLLPIPVLDGGHILFAGIEVVTKKPIRARTMEKLIIPFVVLMIGLFIYITYNDLSRLFHQFF